MHVSFLPDHRVVLVIRVVGIAELAIRTELKLEELVPELSLVSDVVTKENVCWLVNRS
ncbi:GSCOCG00009115001-RA-CDS [Cotesia congregata]|nr:GSCOCG00009115001-RA-CDS [Cotesia congregata]